MYMLLFIQKFDTCVQEYFFIVRKIIYICLYFNEKFDKFAALLFYKVLKLVHVILNSININQVPLTKALRRIMFTQMDVVVIMDEIILWLV